MATSYKTVRIHDLDIFYREAGPVDAPVVLLMHGFPTSSHMFRNVIASLSEKFHVVAPDYPGFGQSSSPDRRDFAYTFENLTNVVESFTKALSLARYTLYLFDYGAPVGFRLALRHPEKVEGLVIQNGNAYVEGLREFWNPIREFWQDPTPERRQSLHFLVEPEATKWQYTNGVSDTSLLDPAAWTLDQASLDRPGNDEIQLDLFYDYRTNVPLYPDFQEFLRQQRPPALILWGKNDFIFPAEGAEAYRRDLPDAEIHLLDTGHFALETHGKEMTNRIIGFLESLHSATTKRLVLETP